MANLVDELIGQVKAKGETFRQESQSDRLSMYLDDYSDKVLEKLKAQFHKDNYDRLYPMVATYYNLFKKIVNLKSVIYQQEAQRTWYTRTGEDQDTNYAEVIANSNIDITMPTANRLTNVNNNSFVRINSDIENNRINYTSCPSELFSVMQNPENPDEITALLHCVVLQDSYDKLDKLVYKRDIENKLIYKYFYWDFEQYIEFDDDFTVINQMENPYKDKNGKGIIPYVFVSNLPTISGNLWNETVNDDLYEGTLQVNVLQTMLNNLLKTTGYRQLFISGIDTDEMQKLNNKASDPLQPIAVSDANARTYTIDIQGNINDVKDAIHDIISEIADNHGVAFNSRTSSAQKQSGMALAIEQEALDDIRQSQIPFYRDAENEIAEKTVIIANNDLNYGNIDIEGSFAVNFYEETKDESITDKMEYDKWLLSKNLKSLTDIYMEIDPDCQDTEEAEKRIQENKEINDEYTNTFNLMPLSDEEPTEEEDETEETE